MNLQGPCRAPCVLQGSENRLGGEHELVLGLTQGLLCSSFSGLLWFLGKGSECTTQKGGGIWKGLKVLARFCTGSEEVTGAEPRSYSQFPLCPPKGSDPDVPARAVKLSCAVPCLCGGFRVLG